MYRGRYESNRRKTTAASARESTPRFGRLMAMAVAATLLLALAIGGTMAWLSTKDEPITNTFIPSQVSCKVTEEFDRATGVKKNVNVNNTGNIDAFIRVKLVTYRTNDQGQHIGGTAVLPEFKLGEYWVLYDGYYYYTKPVAPGAAPAANLADVMNLNAVYNDADGGSQAIDVMAEAIQSVPKAAVKAAWGLDIDDDGNLIVPQQN